MRVVVLGGLVLALGAASPVGARPGSAADVPRPLAFEPNLGQADGSVAFVGRGADRVFVTPEGAVLEVRGARGSSLVGFLPQGAEAAACWEGEGELPGKVSHFGPRMPGGRAVKLPTYTGVRARDVQPGIDMVVRGAEGRFEYDFVVAPRADVEAIRVALPGAMGLQLLDDGALRFETQAGPVLQRAPLAWQEGLSGRVGVPVRCVVLGPAEIGFEVGDYDRSRELVIDPLVYSTYHGGSLHDQVLDVRTNGTGTAWVAGQTHSLDFPVTPGAYLEDVFEPEHFVTKFTPAGQIAWSTYVHGRPNIGDGEFWRTAEWNANEIAIDVVDAGDVFLCSTTGPGLPTSPGAYDGTYNDSSQSGVDAWVGKLNATGSALLFATYLGGSRSDHCGGIEVDAEGRPVVIGSTQSSDFPTTYGASDRALGGGSDIFISRLSADGTALIASTFLGGADPSQGGAEYIGMGARRLAFDAQGNIVVAGHTSCVDFPTTPAAYDPSHNGGSDAFVTKMRSDLSGIVWSTFLGGSDSDQGRGVVLDASGSPIVTGHTAGRFPVTRSAYDRSYNGGGDDVFVSKLSPDGSSLTWSTYIGGRDFDRAHSLAVDAAGQPHVVGRTVSMNFPTTTGAFDRTHNGMDDVFVARLSASGASLTYSTFIGGANTDRGWGISLIGPTRACVVGHTASANYPVQAAYDGDLDGTLDGFVTVLDY